jgi:hypothetical protein
MRATIAASLKKVKVMSSVADLKYELASRKDALVAKGCCLIASKSVNSCSDSATPDVLSKVNSQLSLMVGTATHWSSSHKMGFFSFNLETGSRIMRVAFMQRVSDIPRSVATLLRMSL